MVSLNELKKMTDQELSRVRKESIVAAIKADAGEASTNEMILSELREIRSQLNSVTSGMAVLQAENTSMKQDMTTMKEKIAEQGKVLEMQQNFLEKLDYQGRARNLIITGVSEIENLEDAGNDAEKVKVILEKTGNGNAEITEMTRIGAAAPNKTRRPIKITLKSIDERNKILNDAKNINDAGENVKKIFIRRDVPPAVRKESKRIKEAEKRERDDPANEGKAVVYNRETKTLTVDGQIVDRFAPNFLA